MKYYNIEQKYILYVIIILSYKIYELFYILSLTNILH